MFGVKESISFRAGHRLLFPYKGKCNNVHGEYFTALFYFKSSTLDESGMVIDFTVLKEKLKTWIDENLDHSYICRKDDPLIPVLKSLNLKIYEIDSNPTSENIARLLYDAARSLNLPVVKVEVVESDPSNVAWYLKP